MKKSITAALLLTSLSITGMDFTTRFGPNSPTYNQPLYFSPDHLMARPDKKQKQKKYRDRIKKDLQKYKRKKKTVALEERD